MCSNVLYVQLSVAKGNSIMHKEQVCAHMQRWRTNISKFQSEGEATFIIEGSSRSISVVKSDDLEDLTRIIMQERVLDKQIYNKKSRK